MAQKNNNVIPMTFDDAFYRKIRSLNKENINELLNTLKKCWNCHLMIWKFKLIMHNV